MGHGAEGPLARTRSRRTVFRFRQPLIAAFRNYSAIGCRGFRTVGASPVTRARVSSEYLSVHVTVFACRYCGDVWLSSSPCPGRRVRRHLLCAYIFYIGLESDATSIGAVYLP